MASRSGDRDGYTVAHAIREVFGPEFTWLSWIVVVGGGLLGAACAPLVRASDGPERAWAGPFTCAAVGVVVGGLITLVPRVFRLVVLGSALRTRPAEGGTADRPWWPLRLVAAALVDTPPLRRTAQDFTAAIATVVPTARGLVGRRLWPACAAAFTAPALGLVGAWQVWGAFINDGQLQAGRVPTVGEKAALPMIASIVAGLVLILAIVGVDQLLRRLLQRWATTVRDADADAGFVAQQLGDGLVADAPPLAPLPGTGGDGPVTVPPVRGAAPAPTPQPITADAIEGLGDLFKNG